MSIEKVMIIDDDLDIQTVARMALETMAGWSVETVTDPRAAVEATTQFRPDVILLDWMMPEMTGLEVRSALSNDIGSASIPVIFMTAKVQPQDRQTIRDIGAGLIAKPFDPMTLANQIVEMIELQLRDVA